VAAAAGARFGVAAEVEGHAPGESGEPIKHVFTHRVWRLHPWRLRAKSKPSMGGPGGVHERVLMDAALPEGGVPKLTRKLLERLGDER